MSLISDKYEDELQAFLGDWAAFLFLDTPPTAK